MEVVPRKEQLVNLYLDINPITNKPFYVGVGVDSRLKYYKRNRYHQQIVDSIPNKKFIRKVLYRNIPIQKAWRIEKQIIKKCGRLVYKNGFLANTHEGGPLPFEDENAVHWLKGKKYKDMIPDHVNVRAGKTYEEMFGEERAILLKINHSLKMKGKKTQRIKEKGKTQKEIEAEIRFRERRKNKQYTKNELKSFQEISKRQQGKTMQERLSDPNWVNPSKGKSAKEIYGENYDGPFNKGKTQKEIFGKDYIDPRSKTFTIQIDNELPIFCENERYFCEIFNSNDVLLRKFKKSTEGYKTKRQLNSNHFFSDGSIIKLNYISSENYTKLEKRVIDDIIQRQKNKIENWIVLKSNKPQTKKYLNYNYKFPFTLSINDGESVYCKSETHCCEIFKCDRTIIGMIKKSPDMTYFLKKKSGNSKHIFPENSKIKIEYVSIK